ncbi:hypothetical protein NB643_05260 [Oxalobacter aliiformigenes]|uniref:Uncharacterized protein n=1 Tax=Oxalobacter aliiformigenes TaxID=2946593 RepID=A0ABY7JK00_9BURK|nr:hypothetical protein [Oxalobacter aliiformigenes]WAV92331.1 hypothetical protein NB641_05840 [Oxalobacter aliiformigenes]WAV94261.1 hypothetical protein NB643_05260 [Oxalobacter aliiformigenes]WAV97926.1 hypothetical protein NB645_04150 [Oxalobacter aliiformigenes]
MNAFSGRAVFAGWPGAFSWLAYRKNRFGDRLFSWRKQGGGTFVLYGNGLAVAVAFANGGGWGHVLFSI